MRNSQLLTPSDFSPTLFDNRTIIHPTRLQWMFRLCEQIAVVDDCDFKICKSTDNKNKYSRQHNPNVAYTEMPSNTKIKPASFASLQPLSLSQLAQQPLLFSSGRTWASSGGVS